MKRIICAILVLLMLSSVGCAQINNNIPDIAKQGENEATEAQADVTEVQAESTETGVASTDYLNVPELGRLYTSVEFTTLKTNTDFISADELRKPGGIKEQVKQDLDSGIIPKEITYEYMGKEYLFQFESFSSPGDVTYNNSDIGSLKVKWEDGKKIFYRLSASDNAMEKGDKKTKEEMIRIGEEYLDQNYESDRNKVKVSVDDWGDKVRIIYRKTPLSSYYCKGEVTVDEYGHIISAVIDRRGEDTLSRIDGIDEAGITEIMKTIEPKYRQKNCDCELSASVSYKSMFIGETRYAYAVICLDAEEEYGKDGHSHNYGEIPVYMFIPIRE